MIFLVCFSLLVLTLVFFYTPLGPKYFPNYFKKSPDEIMDAVREEVIPSIVQLSCLDHDGGTDQKTGSGIFYLNPDTKKPQIQTNAHVVLGSDEKFHGCNIYFPRHEDGGFFDSSYFSNSAYLFHDMVSNIDGQSVNGIDIATLSIDGPNKDSFGNAYAFPPQKPDVFQSIGKICNKDKKIKIGDKIYIIGYPNVGGNTITLTEGVVSGFSGDSENLIKISASTNKGNSGGIVIGQNDGCYYGVVDKATFEAGSNLGYVISAGMINAFLNHLSGQKTETLSKISSDPKQYLNQETNIGDTKINYPAGWVVSEKPKSENGNPYTKYITSPLENKLDGFQEAMIAQVNDIDSKNSEQEMKKKVQDIASYAEALKAKNFSIKYGTLPNNIPAYQIYMVDESNVAYGSPSIIQDFVFAIKDKMYMVTIVMGGPSTVELYKSIFSLMINSLKI
jgi:hypothetical protein